MNITDIIVTILVLLVILLFKLNPTIISNFKKKHMEILNYNKNLIENPNILKTIKIDTNENIYNEGFMSDTSLGEFYNTNGNKNVV